MKSLVLTLGHNSSAVLVSDGKILAGYEEERLSGIKSDSSFPVRSILRLINRYNLPSNSSVCVSHWFLDGRLPREKNKYWDPVFLREQFPRHELLELDRYILTHHDAHALSAEVFAGGTFPLPHHIFVLDGFGTRGEFVSVYECDPVPRLIRKHCGFNQSLGMWYQYATLYCDMKMHQDEYKMLGFETRILDVIQDPKDVENLTRLIDDYAWQRADAVFSLVAAETSLTTLVHTQEMVKTTLDLFLDKIKELFHIQNPDSLQTKRILVSYFIQRLTEDLVKCLFEDIKPINLIVVGGLFYNVKINSMLCDLTPGQFCAMPLAGDQGAGLGVYQHYFRDLEWPNNLFWGHRDPIEPTSDGMVRTENVQEVLYSELVKKGIVNLVRGSMEFGPRALCNTSTLALPTTANAEMINKMNGRVNEMPFALVVTREQADTMFRDIDKVHRSLEYMIVTREFNPHEHVAVSGGAHWYPIEKRITCRPQVTDDLLMIKLLNAFGPLINTSFNIHGQPIVFGQHEIELAHDREKLDFPITTVIGE